MSLVKTLAKMAIGVAVAKGVGSMMKKGRGGGSTTAGGGGLFGGAHSPQSGSGGGLEDMMGGIFGGGSGQQQASSTGGLGGLLEGLTGGGASGGGLNDMLRNATQSGGLGGLLSGLAGGAAARTTAAPNDHVGSGGGGDSFGETLNRSFRGEDVTPSQDQEAAAALMLRAMIQAAKSDGKIDDAEREKLLGKLGDISAEERAFVQAEMAAPVDPRGLAGQVPNGLEQQVYAMSVLGIDLDSQAEAKYLHELASAMSLQPVQINSIHDQLGVPKIYN